MHIKYKVGTAKKVVTNIPKEIEYGRFFALLSINAPAKAVAATVPIISQKRVLGYVVSFFPRLLKNSLLAYWTGLWLATIEGTNINVPQKQKKQKGAKSFAKHKLKDIPELIPIKKIIFQKLSLFNRDLIQFIILLFKALISYILSYLREINKAVLLFLVMLVGFCTSARADIQEIMALIKAAEIKYQIPNGLLHSIANIYYA